MFAPYYLPPLFPLFKRSAGKLIQELMIIPQTDDEIALLLAWWSINQ